MPIPTNEEGLTAKQELFIKEYLVDCNATQAAIRAGYSQDTAYSIGWENLKKPEIKSRIDEGLRRLGHKAEVSAEWIRQRLKENVLRSMQAEPVLDSEGNETGVYKYQGNSANRALELLGRDQGMFTDRMEITLNSQAKDVIQKLARLAIECCDESKKAVLVEGLEKIKSEYEI